MDPELKYTQIQVHNTHLQLMPVIEEEPSESAIAANRRESIAIHPTCDCTNCRGYFCCGCPELYTPSEMMTYNSRMTLCPLTSRVVNPVLTTDTRTHHPTICLLSPFTIVIDLVSVIPRCIINICSAII